MFEKAARLKLRFETTQGALSTEELWDLSLNSLDQIAKKVAKLIRDESEDSFIPNTNRDRKVTNNTLRLDILKYVINTKSQENEDRKAKIERLSTIQRLKELAANKADEQLAAQSLEELQKRIAELEATV